MNRRRFIAIAAVSVFAGLALSACATPNTAGSRAGGSPGTPSASVGLGSVDPGLPGGDVVAQGTVLDDGSGAELCLGAVMESYPPQCTGIPLKGWDWAGIDGSESSNGVTWGSYAVQGSYDGTSFAVTQSPVMLALYDPMMAPDPTGGEPGAATEEQLAEIQDAVADRLGSAVLSAAPVDGWLWVDVVWDDGTWQDAADGEFGEGRVIIRSAMREVG